MARRSIAAAIVFIVVSGCAAPSPTHGPSDSPTLGASDSPPQSASASSGEGSAGIFDDPPAPRDLQPTLDTVAASSALVGWEGGTIEAAGPSGASYRLVIPPEALAVPTTITMTPITKLVGFGSLDSSLEHVLGVELEPDGLELILPAQLTMSGNDALSEVGVAAGDYLGRGQDAALMLAKINDAAITFEITHFSGYWSVWPLQMPDWRVFENDRQAALERVIQAGVAHHMYIRRQNELFGLEVPPFNQFVRDMMRTFKYEESVLKNRLALADNGCPEATFAINAFQEYDRQLQLMGLADDPELYAEFARPIPPELFTLVWNLCLDEHYERCVHTGDWPHLATFLLSQAHQREFSGRALTPEQISAGTDRLKRCGHWRVRVTTSQDLVPPGGRVEQEFTSEIDVRFLADGSQKFGLPLKGEPGAAIGYGETREIEVDELDVTYQGEHASLRNILTDQPAMARITELTFVTPWDRSEPIPIRLKLWIDPGTVSFEALHVSGFYAGEWIPEKATWAPGSQLIYGEYPPSIRDGWLFPSTDPYTAEYAFTCPDRQLAGFTVECSIEVIVEHTPD